MNTDPNSSQSSRRRWTRRESTRLPVSRTDAGPEACARWTHCYVVLIRERLAALDPLDLARMTSREVIGELFPLLHSLSQWVGFNEVCRLLAEDAECEVAITEAALRMAQRQPADHWARWWRDVRRPLELLCRAHRADPVRVLYEAGYLVELRGAEAHLDFGGLQESRAGLETLRAARAHLQRHWFGCEPRTRQAARIYIGPVLEGLRRSWMAGREDDW